MPKVTLIKAREILDSRGNPTVEAEIHAGKLTAIAMVPSGASTGEHEALELRDNDPKRFYGKGVLQACENINSKLAPELLNFELGNQQDFDQKLISLDGTENKSNLGANALLACSMAYSKLTAQAEEKHLYQSLADSFNIANNNHILPIPMMNVINGGEHADSGLDIQEFMIMPTGISTFREQLRAGAEIFHTLKGILAQKGLTVAVGDEGGFAPKLNSNEEALDLLIQAIEQAGYAPEKQVSIALDVASSEFFEPQAGKYSLKVNGEQSQLTSSELTNYYQDLLKRYPIISIEDGLDQNDWEGWKNLNQLLGKTTQLVGDDLLVTNPKYIEKAISEKAANSVLIKLNQIGTVTETIKAIQMAQNANWTTVVSHRSGETEDTFIADLSVALNTGQIKTGSLSRSDRTAKYNQLLRIEEYLNQ